MYEYFNIINKKAYKMLIFSDVEIEITITQLIFMYIYIYTHTLQRTTISRNQ